MTAPLVVFDLDGTLIDTAPDLVSSLNHTIATAGLAPVSYSDLTHLVGHGGQVMIRRAFELRGGRLADDELPGMLEVFVEHYGQGMPGASLPYPGLVAALDRLQAAGFRLAAADGARRFQPVDTRHAHVHEDQVESGLG